MELGDHGSVLAEGKPNSMRSFQAADLRERESDSSIVSCDCSAMILRSRPERAPGVDSWAHVHAQHHCTQSAEMHVQCRPVAATLKQRCCEAREQTSNLAVIGPASLESQCAAWCHGTFRGRSATAAGIGAMPCQATSGLR